MVDEDAQLSSAQFVTRVQQCFAVRAGADGFLDLCRSTFCRVTEQVQEAAEKIRADSGLDSVKVHRCAERRLLSFWFSFVH